MKLASEAQWLLDLSKRSKLKEQIYLSALQHCRAWRDALNLLRVMGKAQLETRAGACTAAMQVVDWGMGMKLLQQSLGGLGHRVQRVEDDALVPATL